MTKPLMYETIEQAVTVLGNYKIEERLKAVATLGYDLRAYGHKELAYFVKASREKVTIAMGRMGLRKNIVRAV